MWKSSGKFLEKIWFEMRHFTFSSQEYTMTRNKLTGSTSGLCCLRFFARAQRAKQDNKKLAMAERCRSVLEIAAKVWKTVQAAFTCTTNLPVHRLFLGRFSHTLGIKGSHARLDCVPLGYERAKCACAEMNSTAMAHKAAERSKRAIELHIGKCQ